MTRSDRVDARRRRLPRRPRPDLRGRLLHRAVWTRTTSSTCRQPGHCRAHASRAGPPGRERRRGRTAPDLLRGVDRPVGGLAAPAVPKLSASRAPPSSGQARAESDARRGQGGERPTKREGAARKAEAESAAPRFTVQIAAYSARASAEALRSTISASGHEAYIVESEAPPGAPRYRVRVGSYPSREAAIAAASRLPGAGRALCHHPLTAHGPGASSSPRSSCARASPSWARPSRGTTRDRTPSWSVCSRARSSSWPTSSGPFPSTSPRISSGSRATGAGPPHPGQVRLVSDLSMSIEDRHVLIVEDIVDTGLTLAYLKRNLEARHPRSVRVCVLADKVERREVEVKVDYVGFTVPNVYVVGIRLRLRRRVPESPLRGRARGRVIETATRLRHPSAVLYWQPNESGVQEPRALDGHWPHRHPPVHRLPGLAAERQRAAELLRVSPRRRAGSGWSPSRSGATSSPTI